MILHSVLLLAAVSPDPVASPAIIIDPCVNVDAAEVRRLTAIELGTWRGTTSLAEFQVVVGCDHGVEELRLTDRKRGALSVRSIDLDASEGLAKEANARELALAIAELVRRSDAREAETEAEAPVPSVPPPVRESISEPPRTSEFASSEPPWRTELGVVGAGSVWTGGEALFGADLSGRLHLNRWLIAELRLGARTTRSVALEVGSIRGQGIAGAAGVSIDATPGTRRAGVSFGARLGMEWLNYAVQDDLDRDSNDADAAALHLAGTTTAFVMLSEPLCLMVDAAAGFALHSIALRESDRSASQLNGASVSGAVGLAAQF